MKLTSIRKKVRGMRRRARNLSKWTEHHKHLDIESFLKNQKDYVKIWISPYYNLYRINSKKVGRKNPSYKFRKQILYELIVIYQSWQDQLHQLKQPYYLKIWIGDPEFIDSQVVVALGTEINYYNDIFMQNSEFKKFPITLSHPSFNKFRWERCINGYYVWESDLETIEDIAGIKEKAIRIEEHTINGHVERSFLFQQAICGRDICKGAAALHPQPSSIHKMSVGGISLSMNNNWHNETNLKIQRRKVQRLFIILLISFLLILVAAIIIGYYFTGNTLRDLCGTTNC